MTAEVYEKLCKLTSFEADWTWNKTYQGLYEKLKAMVKRSMHMKFYDAAKPLYLETDIWNWFYSQIVTGKGWYELWV